MVIAIAAALTYARRHPRAPRPAPPPRPAGPASVSPIRPEMPEHFVDVPADALDRKRRNDTRLREEGVPVNIWLPVTESETEAVLPTRETVAVRAVAVLAVAMRAAGMAQRDVDALVDGHALEDAFTPEESAFMEDDDPDAEACGTLAWRFEAGNVLFWAIGLVERLGRPEAPCDPAALVALAQRRPRDALLRDARLRPVAEVLDEADLIYRYRWALVDARLKDRPAPAGLDDDVAMERHHALNWLIRHRDTDWDDITLDT